MLTDRAEPITPTRQMETKDFNTREPSSETGTNNECGIKGELCVVAEEYDKSNVPCSGDRHLVSCDDERLKTDSDRCQYVDYQEEVTGLGFETGLSTEVRASFDDCAVQLSSTDLKSSNNSTKDNEYSVSPSGEGGECHYSKHVSDITPSECNDTANDVIHTENSLTLDNYTTLSSQVISVDNIISDNLGLNDFHSLIQDEEENLVRKSNSLILDGSTTVDTKVTSDNFESGNTLLSSNNSSVGNEDGQIFNSEYAGEDTNLVHELGDISRIFEVAGNNASHSLSKPDVQDDENSLTELNVNQNSSTEINVNQNSLTELNVNQNSLTELNVNQNSLTASSNNNINDSDDDYVHNSSPAELVPLRESDPELSEFPQIINRNDSEIIANGHSYNDEANDALSINSEVTKDPDVNSKFQHPPDSTSQITDNLKSSTPDSLTESRQVLTPSSSSDSESVNSSHSINQVSQERNSPKDNLKTVRFNTDSLRSDSSGSEYSEEENNSESDHSGEGNDSYQLNESINVNETDIETYDQNNHPTAEVLNYAGDLTEITLSQLFVGSKADLQNSQKAEGEHSINRFFETGDGVHYKDNFDNVETLDQVNDDTCSSREKVDSPIQDKQINTLEREEENIETVSPLDRISNTDHHFQTLHQQEDPGNEDNISITRVESDNTDKDDIIHDSFIKQNEDFFVVTPENRHTSLQDENELPGIQTDFKSSLSVDDSPRKSVYSDDFVEENSRHSLVSGRSSLLHLYGDNLCVTPLSYISSDDRAISSRPRVPHCDDSGENTSNDEAEDFEDFAQMNTAPPTTTLNDAGDTGRISRPKSSHPGRRRQIKDSVVYSHRHGGSDRPAEAVTSSKEHTDRYDASSESVDRESTYNDDNKSDDSYSDDLESMSLHSKSGVSRNDAVNIVSDANHFNSHLATPSSRPSSTSSDQRSETSKSRSGEGCSREAETLNQRVHARIDKDNADDSRLNRITSATENLTQMQENLQDMFRQAKTVLSDFQSQLKSRSINDLTEEVPEFTRTLTSLSEAYRACEAVTGGINEQLQDIRVITNEICDLLSTNVKSDDLNAWADHSDTEDIVQEEAKAKSKMKVAKILEAKAVSARAAASVLTAHELAVQAQAEASQAEAAAANARDEAVLAVQRAETARKSAMDKRKKEEEEKKKLAQKERMEEEERRVKKEKEEKERLATGSSGRSSSDEADSKKKEEKPMIHDPATWARFIYSIDQSDFDPGVGVIIKAQAGHLQHEDVVVTLVDQLTGCLPLGECEELISNIVLVSPSDLYTQTNNKLNTSESFIVSIPHCAPRIHPGREPVIRLLTSDDKIVTLATSEVQFDDIKDIRFVECRTKSFGTFAVFLRLKKETLTFNRRGGKVMSSADSRVTLACQSGTFSTNVSFTLEVQQIDPNVLTSIKLRSPEECEKLLSTSPIITMNLPVKFNTPLTLTLPVPPNPSNRPRRPQTAGNKLSSDKMEMVDIRLSSARSTYAPKEGKCPVLVSGQRIHQKKVNVQYWSQVNMYIKRRSTYTPKEGKCPVLVSGQHIHQKKVNVQYWSQVNVYIKRRSTYTPKEGKCPVLVSGQSIHQKKVNVQYWSQVNIYIKRRSERRTLWPLTFLGLSPSKLTKLSENVSSKLTKLSENVSSKLTKLSENIPSTLTKLSENVSSKLTKLSENIQSKLTKLSENVSSKLTKLSENIPSKLTKLSENASSKLTKLSENIPSKLTKLSENVSSKLTKLLENVSSKLTKLSENVSSKLTKLSENVSSKLTKLSENIPTIIRTKPDVTPIQAEKMFCQLMTALTYKQMSVIMRQKSSDPCSVVVTCSQSVNMDRALRTLADEGYDHGPRPISDITVTEGQRLGLRFRGNVVPVDSDVRTMFAFNTYIPFRLKFHVCEQDKFAQRGFDSYRGFSQIFTATKVKRFLDLSEDKDQWLSQGQRAKDENIFEGDFLLCEQLIVLPKPEPETPRPLIVAPVNLSTQGVVNGDLFRFLAVHLEYSDWRKLAQLLNVKHSRIQAILRQNVSKDVTQSIYDMLVTWSKRLPRSMDRTDILCKALTCIRRQDLAEELLTRDVEFRQTRAHQFRDSYLRKAFVTIVRYPLAVTQWKELARQLGIRESEVSDIEARNETDQGRCMGTLNLWRFQTGEEATISLLATKLKQCRFRPLAKDVEKIYQLKF
ncbi:hypothetical protein Btru_055120 [Bulinus truncatus]|nr:hypothetical protein Btru_055120 [Bulinus truncatus]